MDPGAGGPPPLTPQWGMRLRQSGHSGHPGGALVVDAAVVGTARLCVLRQVRNKRLTGFDQRAHRVQVGGTKAFARFEVSIFDELIPTDGKPAVWMARTVDAPELLQS